MRTAGAALSLLFAACGGASPPPAAMTVIPARPDDRLPDLLLAALTADVRLETPDSLYAGDATFVANGIRRFAPPRFAGLGPGGEVGVTSTRMEVRGAVAWAQVEYRWISTALGRATEGQATFVLISTTEGAWRIRHAHSSSPDA